MILAPDAFESNEAVEQTSVKFLKRLQLDEGSEFEEIKDSLQYLESITLKADNELPDVQDFALHLFDVAHKLQTEYLNGRLNENSDRLAELFQQELENLFNTLPPELRALHNLTIEALLKPKEAAPEVVENNIIEALKESIKPEALEAKEPPLSSKLLEKIKSKAKLSPKQIMQVLAACAALSIPSDKASIGEAPEGVYFTPENLSQQVSAAVETQIQINPTVPVTTSTAPEKLQTPAFEEPFELLKQAAYPSAVVSPETSQMNSRLQFVLNDPERRALFDTLRQDPRYRHDIALLGIIESNLDASAISHSGAMGPLQDMGGLQGAFGDPDTVVQLARADLLPQINNARYNQIINLHKRGTEIQRGTLLEFLIAERNAGTDFWKEFLSQQTALLVNAESAAQIADLYLDDLVEKADRSLPINGDPLEALNFAVMSYNLGMGHLHTLRRLMNLEGVNTFNTHSVLSFIERDDFHDILRKNNLGELHNNYEEAQGYLARYIALQQILHNQSPATV